MWQILKIAATRTSLLHFPRRALVWWLQFRPVLLLQFFSRFFATTVSLACSRLEILGIVIYNAVCAPYSRSSVRNISALKVPTTVDGCGRRLILSMCTIFQTASRYPPSRRLLYPCGKIARLLYAPRNCMKKCRIFVKLDGTRPLALINLNLSIHERLLELI